MERTLAPCFVCGKEMERVFAEIPMQPRDGVTCHTNGNFGSRVYDDMHYYLTFVVCDDCLEERRNRALITKPARPLLPRYEPWGKP